MTTSCLPVVTRARGALVAAPLGNREVLGVVWGAAEGTVGDNRLKVAEPLEGAPRAAGQTVRLHRLGGRLHPEPAGRDPGHGAAQSRGAFEPEARRIAYVRGSVTPPRMCAARTRALEVAGDGLARSVSGLAEDANVSTAVVRGLIQHGALVPTELPEFAPFASARCRTLPRRRLNGDQAAAARCPARRGGGGRILRASAGWRHRLGQDRSLFRSGGRRRWRAGKQVLILLPEIALTVQFLERFAAALRRAAGGMAQRSVRRRNAAASIAR